MKVKVILVLALIFPLFLKSQVYEKIISPTDTFFMIDINSIDSIPIALPDGRYKAFFSNNPDHIKYQFTIKSNKVNGFFAEYGLSGNYWTRGSYHEDSLWTFLKESGSDSDTTFKTGNWKYYYVLGPTISYLTTQVQQFEYVFDQDSLYKEKWFYSDGRKLKESIIHQRKGVIYEKYFYYNGNISSEYQTYNNHKNSVECRWNSGDTLTDVIINKRLYIEIEPDTSKYYRICDDCTKQDIYNNEGEFEAEIWFDKEGKIRYYRGHGIIIEYNQDGNIQSIGYLNKRKNWKTKQINN